MQEDDENNSSRDYHNNDVLQYELDNATLQDDDEKRLGFVVTKLRCIVKDKSVIYLFSIHTCYLYVICI